MHATKELPGDGCKRRLMALITMDVASMAELENLS
jgi:hypothetical protein